MTPIGDFTLRADTLRPLETGPDWKVIEIGCGVARPTARRWNCRLPIGQQ